MGSPLNLLVYLTVTNAYSQVRISCCQLFYGRRSAIMTPRIKGPSCFDISNASKEDVLRSYREILEAHGTQDPGRS